VIGVKRAVDDVDETPLMLEFYRLYHGHGEQTPMRDLALAQRRAMRESGHRMRGRRCRSSGSWLDSTTEEE